MVTALRPLNRILGLVQGITFEPVLCTPTKAWPMTTGLSPKLFDSRMRHFSPHTLGWTMSRKDCSRATLLGSAKSISGCPTEQPIGYRPCGEVVQVATHLSSDPANAP